MNLFDFFTLVWFSVTVVGWIAYKCRIDNVDSWEAGVKYCTVGVVRWLWEEITGKSNSRDVINSNFILANQEVIEIIKRMGSVYEFPKLTAFGNNNRFIRIEFSAVSLINKYSECSNAMLREIVCNIIQTYYLETRECEVIVFVPVATATRVCIDIPLTESAKEYLSKNYSSLSQSDNNTSINDILEEEIVCTDELEG